MLIKSEATYEIAKPGGDRCDDCKWFRKPKRCELVEGTISAGGWCKVFHRARKRMKSADESRAYVREMRG